jgi:hypothetical protein
MNMGGVTVEQFDDYARDIETVSALSLQRS